MDTQQIPPVTGDRPLAAPGQPGGAVPPAPPPAPAKSRRRRWPRILVFSLLVVVLFAVAWVGLSAWLLNARMERIPSDELPSLSASGPGPVNYLLVGSDSRENLPPEFGDWFGDFGGQRADVIMVLHASGGRVQMLSLPRDLKVQIPGQGVNRVNAAYAFGGPDLLVQTVQVATGLPIHHYLEVGFADFASVVDALGGVDVTFVNAARDNKSGLDVVAGTDHLDGIQALAYARSRTYEELVGSDWVGVDQGDIGRTARQQLVVSELLANATSVSNALRLPSIATGVGESLTADEGIGLMDLAKLAWAVQRGSIEATTLPVVGASEGGVAYVVPAEPEATRVLAAFTAGDPMTVPEPVTP